MNGKYSGTKLASQVLLDVALDHELVNWIASVAACGHPGPEVTLALGDALVENWRQDMSIPAPDSGWTQFLCDLANRHSEAFQPTELEYRSHLDKALALYDVAFKLADRGSTQEENMKREYAELVEAKLALRQSIEA